MSVIFFAVFRLYSVQFSDAAVKIYDGFCSHILIIFAKAVQFFSFWILFCPAFFGTSMFCVCQLIAVAAAAAALER